MKRLFHFTKCLFSSLLSSSRTFNILTFYSPHPLILNNLILHTHKNTSPQISPSFKSQSLYPSTAFQGSSSVHQIHLPMPHRQPHWIEIALPPSSTVSVSISTQTCLRFSHLWNNQGSLTLLAPTVVTLSIPLYSKVLQKSCYMQWGSSSFSISTPLSLTTGVIPSTEIQKNHHFYNAWFSLPRYNSPDFLNLPLYFPKSYRFRLQNTISSNCVLDGCELVITASTHTISETRF